MQTQRNPRKKQVVVTTTVVKNAQNNNNKGSNNRRMRRRNRKQKQRAQNQGQAGSQRRGSSGSVMVLPCTLNYARALADPWGAHKLSSDVCIPDNQSLPSFKYAVRNRGVFTIGTQGFGFVLCNPYLGGVNFSTAKFLKYSTSALVTPSLPDPANTVGVVNLVSSSPLTDGFKTRLVTAGLRCRYTGTELNRGGQAIAYRSTSGPIVDGNNDDHLEYQTDLTAVAALERAELMPNNRQWIGTVYAPPSSELMVYTEPDPNYAINASDEGYLMAVLVTGTPGNTFEFDFCGFYEAVSNAGGKSVPNVSKSHSDPDGFGFVQNVYAQMADSDFGKTLWSVMKSSAASYVSSHVPFSSQAALEWSREF